MKLINDDVKNKRIFAMKRALKYLSSADKPWQMLLVNKEFK